MLLASPIYALRTEPHTVSNIMGWVGIKAKAKIQYRFGSLLQGEGGGTGGGTSSVSCICPVCHAVLSNQNVLHYHLRYVHAVQSGFDLLSSMAAKQAKTAGSTAATTVASAAAAVTKKSTNNT